MFSNNEFDMSVSIYYKLLFPNFIVFLEWTCDALRNLVPFVQFKKREKHP